MKILILVNISVAWFYGYIMIYKKNIGTYFNTKYQWYKNWFKLIEKNLKKEW